MHQNFKGSSFCLTLLGKALAFSYLFSLFVCFCFVCVLTLLLVCMFVCSCNIVFCLFPYVCVFLFDLFVVFVIV